MPVDLALGVIFPLHAHIGMNWVISDYVPPDMRTSVRTAMAREGSESAAAAAARQRVLLMACCSTSPSLLIPPRPPPGIPPRPQAGATVLCGLGLLKLNLTGDGITETLKKLWREPKVVEEAASA